MISFFRNILERNIFGVSSWWGKRLGIKSSFVRLFFIYSAFANAITILIYLVMIFLLKMRHHFKYKRRNSVFDL